ncbi:MAG: response regulator transcription factor [Spirochaetales bacterium]|nr:response regulator transcription factor [Spirochaetales bacterium]
MGNNKIRLLLADDQKLFVENLKVIIELTAPEFEVVKVARNGREAVRGVEEHKPDIVLMDVRMPEMDGVEAARIIHNKHKDIKIMMLTTFDDDAYVHNALAGGAAGYILKNTSSPDLVQAIKALHSGQALITPSLLSKLISSPPPDDETRHNREKGLKAEYDLDCLSSRERDVLFLLSRGYDNNEIGERLYIARQTVKNHISHIYDKLNIHDRMSAMKAAGDPRLKEWCGHLMEQ